MTYGKWSFCGKSHSILISGTFLDTPRFSIKTSKVP
jgi:hypothetical protein